jgi:hypothetical protein
MPDESRVVMANFACLAGRAAQRIVKIFCATHGRADIQRFVKASNLSDNASLEKYRIRGGISYDLLGASKQRRNFRECCLCRQRRIAAERKVERLIACE